MKDPKRLYIATIVLGVLSFVAFIFERLALTDIFHGEQDVRLEWAVVSAAFIPMVLFHILGLVSAYVAAKHAGRRGDPPTDAA